MSVITKRRDAVVIDEKGSNRIVWPPEVIAQAEKMGYRPFAGYWVRQDDNYLYTLEEIGIKLP